MVNFISKIVQTLIDNDLSLQDALQKDYGNYSAIARMLKPKVEEILGQDVKLESIITADLGGLLWLCEIVVFDVWVHN